MKRHLEIPVLVSCCALMGTLAVLLPEKTCLAQDFHATLNVMAYGREVTVIINGARISKIEGGASEEIGLHLAGDSALNNAPPAMRQSFEQLYCLKEGENTIEVSFRPKKEANPQGPFRLSIDSRNYQVPVLVYMKDPSVRETTAKGTFRIFTKQPAGFKTVVMQ
jgi:hypothetical protein